MPSLARYYECFYKNYDEFGEIPATEAKFMVLGEDERGLGLLL